MAKPRKHHGKWRIRPINFNGERESMVFETYDEAIHALQINETERRQVRYGQCAAIQKNRTFNEICDYWINLIASEKRSGRNDISIIEKHLRPRLGKLRLSAISAHHGNQYQIEKGAELDKKTIFNHLTLLVAMLNMAKNINWLSTAPKIKKPKVSIISSSFNYLKTKEEVQRFLGAAALRGDEYYALYSAAIFSGMRAGELAGLQWSDIDFSQRLICIQRSFEGPTKSGEARHVPILDPLLGILIQRRNDYVSKWVFPNHAFRMHQPSARIFQEIFKQVLQAADFPYIIKKGKRRGYIVFHDLRHTFASHWVMNGGDIFKLQKILGHQSISMTQRYAHLSPTAFVNDLERLTALGPSSAAEVIKIPTAISRQNKI